MPRKSIQSAEEKRLRRNAAQRTRYAQLPQHEKESILQKKKQLYAEKKMIMANKSQLTECTSSGPTSHSTANISEGPNMQDFVADDTEGEQTMKTFGNDSINIKGNSDNESRATTTYSPQILNVFQQNPLSGYKNNDMVIKDIGYDQRDKWLLLENASDKGKAQTNYRSSDLGSCNNLANKGIVIKDVGNDLIDQRDRGPLLKNALDKRQSSNNVRQLIRSRYGGTRTT